MGRATRSAAQAKAAGICAHAPAPAADPAPAPAPKAKSKGRGRAPKLSAKAKYRALALAHASEPEPQLEAAREVSPGLEADTGPSTLAEAIRRRRYAEWLELRADLDTIVRGEPRSPPTELRSQPNADHEGGWGSPDNQPPLAASPTPHSDRRSAGVAKEADVRSLELQDEKEQSSQEATGSKTVTSFARRRMDLLIETLTSMAE
ncbi:hypothetical protein TWF694_005252 [Orbilia ellipsospora]|uniref:Uncharacterized protein n=1 Tax=Orbilia ellipsospora TaxID=2528407 RepID=A0AAV9WSJ0_9PEZI